MKKLLLFCLPLLLLSIACNKDEGEVTLKGKWFVENMITKEYENGVLRGTYTDPGNGAKYDFQDNGILLIMNPFGSDHPYSILPGSKVVIDGDQFEIRDLSRTHVTLYIREDYGNDYQELFINLKR